jgi:hypothetical protein
MDISIFLFGLVCGVSLSISIIAISRGRGKNPGQAVEKNILEVEVHADRAKKEIDILTQRCDRLLEKMRQIDNYVKNRN